MACNAAAVTEGGASPRSCEWIKTLQIEHPRNPTYHEIFDVFERLFHAFVGDPFPVFSLFDESSTRGPFGKIFN
jgi:hypothetical protein